jgi:hypothetical protein
MCVVQRVVATQDVGAVMVLSTRRLQSYIMLTLLIIFKGGIPAIRAHSFTRSVIVKFLVISTNRLRLDFLRRSNMFVSWLRSFTTE